MYTLCIHDVIIMMSCPTSSVNKLGFHKLCMISIVNGLIAGVFLIVSYSLERNLVKQLLLFSCHTLVPVKGVQL